MRAEEIQPKPLAGPQSEQCDILKNFVWARSDRYSTSGLTTAIAAISSPYVLALRINGCASRLASRRSQLTTSFNTESIRFSMSVQLRLACRSSATVKRWMAETASSPFVFSGCNRSVEMSNLVDCELEYSRVTPEAGCPTSPEKLTNRRCRIQFRSARPMIGNSGGV